MRLHLPAHQLQVTRPTSTIAPEEPVNEGTARNANMRTWRSVVGRRSTKATTYLPLEQWRLDNGLHGRKRWELAKAGQWRAENKCQHHCAQPQPQLLPCPTSPAGGHDGTGLLQHHTYLANTSEHGESGGSRITQNDDGCTGSGVFERLVVAR